MSGENSKKLMTFLESSFVLIDEDNSKKKKDMEN
jgi:hypothetical protein